MVRSAGTTLFISCVLLVYVLADTKVRSYAGKKDRVVELNDVAKFVSTFIFTQKNLLCDAVPALLCHSVHFETRVCVIEVKTFTLVVPVCFDERVKEKTFLFRSYVGNGAIHRFADSEDRAQNNQVKMPPQQ